MLPQRQEVSAGARATEVVPQPAGGAEGALLLWGVYSGRERRREALIGILGREGEGLDVYEREGAAATGGLLLEGCGTIAIATHIFEVYYCSYYFYIFKTELRGLSDEHAICVDER